MFDIALIYGKVWIDGKFVKTNLYIKDDKIADMSDMLLPSVKTIDLKGLEIIPGIIDPHVHFELDLGHIKSIDGFDDGSKAAIYGGVTTIIDFLDPVDQVEDLEKALKKRLNEAKDCQVNYKFHATIKNPKCNLESFILEMKRLGMNTLKLFTTYSSSSRRTYDKEIIELLKLSKKHQVLILAHIENDDIIDLSPNLTYKDLPKSRQSISEISEALKIASYVKKTQGNLYMVHVSSGLTIQKLLSEYRDILNQNFFIESCPQYFTFSNEKLKDQNGYLYTCAPPLRSQNEVNLLKDYIEHIQTIGTDHCTFLKKDKQKEYLNEIPLGVGSIEHSFQIMNMHFGERIIPKMTKRVAEIHQIPNKGELKVGYDADLFIYKPQLFNIKDHHGKCDYNIYHGKTVPGEIVATMIGGSFRFINHEFYEEKGKYIPWSKNI
jgi:dihydropyrimidinase